MLLLLLLALPSASALRPTGAAYPSAQGLRGVASARGAVMSDTHEPLIRASPLRCRSRAPAMFFDQYDKDAMRLIMDAQTEARNLGVEAIGTEHLLLAATLQQDGVAEALKRAGVQTKPVRDELQQRSGGGVNPLERIFASTSRDELLPFGPDTERCLRSALEQAKSDGESLVKPKVLMLKAVEPTKGAQKGTRLMVRFSSSRH